MTLGTPRFPYTSCSSCGRIFGPGDHGYSHCDSHRPPPLATANGLRIAALDQEARSLGYRLFPTGFPISEALKVVAAEHGYRLVPFNAVLAHLDDDDTGGMDLREPMKECA